ncbi:MULTISPECIES: hypothetical protein [unclassified Sporosarcina]|uniref:hypothetical protein n=1 Tax=unclassified Sporosarcina TaxID=2647733 RepID=UPI0020424964|nr:MULTISPECIES: hypothetical protein [unclassified Sporosarcina]GKV67093.1 hypothetical protein NCCP2331_32460 [Sporosarcina sp. NCCP-2331]GLB57432.1 hypothetical protein NCCP2378_32200 [Sporosarcina sp. NCCP-2378]
MSSYAVTCISLYLVMTWVTMTVFSLEGETEKNLLIVQLNSKQAYLYGKWIVCFIFALGMGIIVIMYPLLFSIFKDQIQTIQMGVVIYGHLASALFGILVGSFFSFLKLESKRFTWLSAMFVIAVSLAGAGIVEKASIFKWFILLFPPVIHVIKHFTDDVSYSVGNDFWMDAIWVIAYLVLVFILTRRLFLKKE